MIRLSINKPGVTPFVAVLAAFMAIFTVTAPARADEPNYDSMSTRELEDELDRTSLGGPIVLLATGGGLAIGGAVFTLYGAVFEAVCTDDWDSYSGTGSNCGGKALLIVGGTGLVVGATLATIGGVWLGSRIGKRRRLKRALERTEGAWAGEWQVGVAPVSSGQGLNLKLTF